MKLTKCPKNPILKANKENWWEDLGVLNPACIYEDGTFYLFYRAASNDDKHTISIGLAKSNDGFEIASEDLKLRGPGDFFGFRQSGDPMFKMADLYTDADTLKLAKNVLDELRGSTVLSSFEYYLKKFDRGYLCL